VLVYAALHIPCRVREPGSIVPVTPPTSSARPIYIGNISVLEIAPNGEFPITPDYGHGRARTIPPLQSFVLTRTNWLPDSVLPTPVPLRSPRGTSRCCHACSS